MSALNGDKSRFQLQRKAGVHRRAASRRTLASLRLALPPPPGPEEAASDGGREREGGLRPAPLAGD